MIHKRRLLTGIALAALVVLMIAPAQAQKVRLTWTAGGTGGGWFVMAGGLAKIIQEQAPDIQINVIPGGGTRESVLLAAAICAGYSKAPNHTPARVTIVSPSAKETVEVLPVPPKIAKKFLI